VRKPDHAARRLVIREWMALSKDKRSSPAQAEAFIAKAGERHVLTGHGDSAQRMRGWLLPRVGKN
jgi:hypothetical protein